MSEYHLPADLTEAVSLLEAHAGQARILAGGTDLLPEMLKGEKSPCPLVDIRRIPGLDSINLEDGYLTVGAAVTFAQLRQDKIILKYAHALAEAAASVGALGLQTSATWVGNIVQAMPAADGAIAGLALEAHACLLDASGSAWHPLESLFLAPGKSAVDPTRQILTHLRIPLPKGRYGSAWQRIGRRSALTLPILNCAVKLELEDESIARAVIALGPVATKPFRAHRAESLLSGVMPSPALFAEAGQAARQEADPRSNPLRASRAYRLEILPVLVMRALEVAHERAGEF